MQWQIEKGGQIQQLDITGELYPAVLKIAKSVIDAQNMCVHGIPREAGERAVSGYSQNHPGDCQHWSLLSTIVQLKPLHMAAELNTEGDHHELHVCLDHQVLHVCQEPWV